MSDKLFKRNKRDAKLESLCNWLSDTQMLYVANECLRRALSEAKQKFISSLFCHNP